MIAAERLVERHSSIAAARPARSAPAGRQDGVLRVREAPGAGTTRRNYFPSIPSDRFRQVPSLSASSEFGALDQLPLREVAVQPEGDLGSRK